MGKKRGTDGQEAIILILIQGEGVEETLKSDRNEDAGCDKKGQNPSLALGVRRNGIRHARAHFSHLQLCQQNVKTSTTSTGI